MRAFPLRRVAALGLVLGLVGLSGVSPPAAHGQEAPGGGSAVQVDPAVVDAVAREGDADFWVVLREEADLHRAEAIDDWNQRGQYVYDQLTATAAASQHDLVADLTARGVEHESSWIVNAVYVHGGDEAALDAARRDRNVAAVRAPHTYALPEARATVPLPGSADARGPGDSGPPGTSAVEWGIADIGADRVWEELGVRGEGITIATIDTGAEHTHPALVEQYRGNRGDGTFDHDYDWFDPGGDDCPDAPCDTDAHGTHVLGTAVGDDGGEHQIGVAPGARWISALGCPAGSCPDVDLFSSAEWVLAPTDRQGQDPRPDLRANVVNNSWAAVNGSVEDPFFDEIIDAWNAAGIFSTFAAGGGGPECDTMASPADDPDAWAVGSYDIDGIVAPFSGRGPAGEPPLEYVKPNHVAPGVGIVSSVPGGGYATLSGTSMSTAHTTGAVALIWSASAGTFGDIGATRRILDDTAIDVEDLTCGGDADANNVYGEGRLDAFAAVSVSPRGPTGTLTGTVTDAATGAPLAGAGVTAVVDGVPRTTLTGADGSYELRLPVGTHDVTASAAGHVDVTRRAEIVEDRETTLDFALGTAVPALDPDRVDRILLPGEQRTTTVELSNGGDAPYEWEAVEEQGGAGTIDVPWLDVDPDEGTVAPGDRQGLAVRVDATGLEPGAYEAQVAIGSHTARSPRLVLPVRLVVTPYRQGVNAGGGAHTDGADDPWAADQPFDGSWGYERDSRSVTTRRPIGGTGDDALYQDARVGRSFAYRFDGLPAGTYEIELHFAEIQGRAPGERRFDVTADTAPLLVGYDIAEDVGQDTAVVHRFTVEVADGGLRVRFLERRGSGRPIVNAVRLTHRPDLAG